MLKKNVSILYKSQNHTTLHLKTRQDKTRQHKTTQDKTTQHKTTQGKEGHGTEWGRKGQTKTRVGNINCIKLYMYLTLPNKAHT